MSLVVAQFSDRLVLASASETRAAMLRRAGIEAATDAADVDEAAIKDEFKASGQAIERAALALAEAKAQAVSRRHPDRLVIGADQMLDCDGSWLDKPSDAAQAALQLKHLSGRTHHLISSAVVVENGQVLWHGTEIARLSVRPLGDAFIAAYVAAMGPAILGSVGAYQIEGLGAQLFERIEGDVFTILGLPLLQLLDFLRGRGVLLS